MELQQRYADLQARGMGLVAVSYDDVEVLKAFAERRNITFPLISDPGSAIIRQYGLLNPEYTPGDESHGVPYPGTFVLDADRRVVSRHFEEPYQERATLGGILVGQDPPRAEDTGTGRLIAADHLDVTLSASAGTVAPGQRFSLVIDVAPHRRIHVYAPGNADYIPIALELDADPLLRVHPIAFPPSEEYFFEPLNERVQVYGKPFRLVQEVTVLATREAQAALRQKPSLTIAGKVRYQACDDRVCFPPASVPVSWTIDLRPLDR